MKHRAVSNGELIRTRVLGKEVLVVVVPAAEAAQQRARTLPYLDRIVKESDPARANVAPVTGMKPIL